jgi:hypothetical protein
MATRKEVEGYLQGLEGEVKLVTIVNKIKSIKDLKTKHSKYFTKQDNPYEDSPFGVDLQSLYVDMAYQRPLNLSKIFDHLERSTNTFDPFLAGHIDVCKRPNGRTYDWDGFRRAVIALIKGINVMPASYVEHKNLSSVECRELEAEKFEIKNGYAESMKPEEIWKSQLVQRKENALMIHRFLDEADLEVLGVMKKGYVMSSFGEVQKVLLGNKISQKYLVEASLMIQKAWSNQDVVKGYVMLGLAQLLEIIDRLDTEETNEKYNGDAPIFVSELESIEQDLIDYANDGHIQFDVQNPRLSGNLYGSIAYNIATKVCGMDNKNPVLLGETDREDVLTN